MGKKTLTGISLFSGAGGLDMGLNLGCKDKIKWKAVVEKDKDSRKTLELNNKDSDMRIYRDIADLDVQKMMNELDMKPRELFLVSGGPPCQTFSTAGQRDGTNDKRGKVIENYFQIIRRFKPRFFVFENVRGLMSVAIKHRKYVDRIESEKVDPEQLLVDEEEKLGSLFSKIFWPKMKSLGYEVVFGLVCSADYGTPQIRDRLIFIGSRDKEFKSGNFRKRTGQTMTIQDILPPTHHQFAPYPPIKPWQTLGDAISEIPEPDKSETFSYSDERKKIWKRIPPGKHWTYIRDNEELFPEGLAEIMGGAINSGGGKVGFWRRLSFDKPSPTLPTQPQHKSTGLCHPLRERPLSVPEFAAIQEFPPNYKFAGDTGSQYRQIGNAVPISLGKAIGGLLESMASKLPTIPTGIPSKDQMKKMKKPDLVKFAQYYNVPHIGTKSEIIERLLAALPDEKFLIKMKKKELAELSKLRDLPHSGTKAELIQRLLC